MINNSSMPIEKAGGGGNGGWMINTKEKPFEHDNYFFKLHISKARQLKIVYGSQGGRADF